MNLQIAICDDDIKDIEIIEQHISQYNIQTNNNVILTSFTEANKLISQYKNYDVVLLDIEMPDTNGMTIAKQLRRLNDDLIIVFTTSYPEYMQDSFEVQPFQFLSKPITYDIIRKLLTDIIKKISRNLNTLIVIDDNNEKNFVYLKEIIYISVIKGKKGIIKYQLHDHEFITKGTISSIEKDFISHGFVSTTRGVLVNINQIKSMNSTRVLLKNNDELPISRRRLKEIQKKYTNHIIQIMN